MDPVTITSALMGILKFLLIHKAVNMAGGAVSKAVFKKGAGEIGKAAGKKLATTAAGGAVDKALASGRLGRLAGKVNVENAIAGLTKHGSQLGSLGLTIGALNAWEGRGGPQPGPAMLNPAVMQALAARRVGPMAMDSQALLAAIEQQFGPQAVDSLMQTGVV